MVPLLWPIKKRMQIRQLIIHTIMDRSKKAEATPAGSSRILIVRPFVYPGSVSFPLTFTGVRPL